LDEAVLAEALAELAAGPRASSAERILVVDDVPLEAKLAGQVLRKAGYEVRELNDELAIMDAIREFEPDLILMDLNMPKATGAELTAVIRDHSELLLTPIVFLSGERDPDAQREALRLGADEFLTKPIDPKGLVSTVRARLTRSRVIRSRYVSKEEVDASTGLLTRRAFLRLLAQHLEEHALGMGDAVLFLNIDRLDYLVKYRGSSAKDLVFAHIASVLRDVVGGSERAARFGEYSFTVLARSDDAEAPRALAERLQRAVHDHVIQLGSAQERLSLSIGIAPLTDQADVATQVSRAQSACWTASGRGTGQIAEHAATAAAADADQADTRQLDGLPNAAERGACEVRYLPLIGLADGIAPARRYLLQAWMRPMDASEDMAARPLSLPLERLASDRVARLDCAIMERALEGLAADRATNPAGDDGLQLFVPQSIATMRGRRWVLWMRDRIVELRLAGHAPVVAVRCDDMLEHLGVASALFPLFGRLGIKICVSGLSTEPAALSLLAEYPIAFVDPAPEVFDADPQRGELVRLIRAAHEQRIQVIAPGVRDAAMLSRVWESGADLACGDFVQAASTTMDFDFAAAQA
jgi:diguanylate cyclase (GGDEF)-like protein